MYIYVHVPIHAYACVDAFTRAIPKLESKVQNKKKQDVNMDTNILGSQPPNQIPKVSELQQ